VSTEKRRSQFLAFFVDVLVFFDVAVLPTEFHAQLALLLLGEETIGTRAIAPAVGSEFTFLSDEMI